MKDHNILSIGEILFDVFSSGKILGGAPFNFLYHVLKLTGRGNLVSKVGVDENGKEILKRLKEMNFNTDLLQVDKSNPTGMVNVLVDGQGVPSYEIVENTAYDFIEYNSKVGDAVNNTSLIAFGSLAQKNHVSRRTIQKLFEYEATLFCDLNLRQDFYTKEIVKSTLDNCDILKINENELEKINDLFLQSSTDDLVELSKKVIEIFELEVLALTLGENGAILFNRQEYFHSKKRIDKLVDTVGAGDAYSAILCLGYLNNYSLEKINKAAVKFSSEICMIKGAIPQDDSFYEKYREFI